MAAIPWVAPSQSVRNRSVEAATLETDSGETLSVTISIGGACCSSIAGQGDGPALFKAADENLEVRGSVLASDAFFPFPDGVEAAMDAGVAAILQPGGSVRDEEVVAAANEHDLAMAFTGIRHFRH